MDAFILWSGGKESFLSLIKAKERGFNVKYALSYVEEENKRLLGCALREEVIRKQVKLLEMKFIPIYGSKRKGNFLKELFNVIKGLDTGAGIFGIVNDFTYRNMFENVCRRADIKAIFPLWYYSHEVIVKEALRSFTSIVICRKKKLIPKKFLGKPLDGNIMDFLRSKKLSVSGENGEYQTLVVEWEDKKLEYELGKRFQSSIYECVDVSI